MLLLALLRRLRAQTLARRLPPFSSVHVGPENKLWQLTAHDQVRCSTVMGLCRQVLERPQNASKCSRVSKLVLVQRLFSYKLYCIFNPFCAHIRSNCLEPGYRMHGCSKSVFAFCALKSVARVAILSRSKLEVTMAWLRLCHELALTYNDVSLLENMHVSTAFKIAIFQRVSG